VDEGSPISTLREGAEIGSALGGIYHRICWDSDFADHPWIDTVLTGTTTLDFFIVNVAIPAIQRDLNAGPAMPQFVVAGFGMALAAGLITGRRLGDLYGRRRMFVLGLGLFTLASLARGLAPGMRFLVGARVAQGLAAALLMPQVLAIVNIVRTGAYRARAFNLYGLALGFGGGSASSSAVC
jgi:MFS family permease